MIQNNVCIARMGSRKDNNLEILRGLLKKLLDIRSYINAHLKLRKFVIYCYVFSKRSGDRKFDIFRKFGILITVYQGFIKI